jgi:hypothetical protein
MIVSFTRQATMIASCLGLMSHGALSEAAEWVEWADNKWVEWADDKWVEWAHDKWVEWADDKRECLLPSRRVRAQTGDGDVNALRMRSMTARGFWNSSCHVKWTTL